MAKLLTYSNALNPQVLNQKVIEDGYIYDVIDSLEYSKEHYDVVVSRNGVITEENFYVEDTDLIAISFRPKAGITALGGYILSALGVYGASTAAAFVVGAIAYVGASVLINSLFAPKESTAGGFSTDNSPTYSWDAKANTVTQGGVVPVLYGTHRVTPPVIAKYIESSDAKQYLNLLFAVADGETDIDASSVFINDEPITNFRGASVYTRRGTINQTPIGIFNTVKSDVSLNKKLTKGGDYAYAQTSGNTATGLTVSIYAPQGLWFSYQGGTFWQTVTLSAEYESLTGQWLPIAITPVSGYNILGYWVRGEVTGSSTWEIINNQLTQTSSSSFLYYKFETQDEASKAVQSGDMTLSVESLETLPDNSVTTNVCIDESSIVGGTTSSLFCSNSVQVFEEREDYSYISPVVSVSSASQTPKRMTYKISDLPAGQYNVRVKHISSSHAAPYQYADTLILEYLQEEMSDSFSYPTTALMALRILATDQLNGSMPRVSVIASNDLNNPSLACKDIIEKSGHTLSTKELESFDDWEAHCNTKKYSCNAYIDQQQTVRQILDIIAPLGRGNVLQTGSNWRVIIDRADESAVQGFLFTMGNIVKDSFSEEFLPIQDRANKIEITYYDKNYDYKPQILELSNSTYDSVIEINTASLNYIGCTDRDMAIKYAKYLLNTNRYITITQSFQVDLEAIVARVGDIIKVAHDVPEQGMVSGRVISSTTESVTLDNEVDMTIGNKYYIEVRRFNTNTIEVIEVVNSETITDTLTFKTPLATALNQYDIYSFGELSRISKKMRILSISNTSELKSTISAIEYVPDVYNDVANIEAEDLSYFGVKYLQADESITYKNTTAISNISTSWIGESLWYDIYVDSEFNQRVYTSEAYIENIPSPSTVNIEIRDDSGRKADKDVTLLGRFYPPVAPTEFKAIQNSDVVRFSWIKSDDGDVVKYELRQGATWESGFKIGTVGNVTTFEWYPDTDTTYRFWIKALDNSSVYSATASMYQLNVTGILDNKNIILEYDGIDTDVAPCGTTTGLVFVVGTGYVPIISAQYSDLTGVTYLDLPGGLTYDEAPSFESCVQDTTEIGLTKIRLFAQYSASSASVTYLTYPNRTYNAFPYDTYETISSLTDLKFYYSISDDDITYSAWIEYTGIVDETFRYIKFKYEFVGEIEGKDISISDFRAFLDVPDITYEIDNKQIVNSEAISYNTYNLDFYSTPYISVTSRDTVSLPVVSSLTKDGFTLEAYDTDGVATTASFNISIKGY